MTARCVTSFYHSFAHAGQLICSHWNFDIGLKKNNVNSFTKITKIAIEH